MHTLVVVPTFNEAENIEELLTRVRASVPDADILVVDDNSPDGTGDLAEKTGAELGQIKVSAAPEGRPGKRLPAGFRQGLDSATRSSSRWTPTCRTGPDVIPLLLAKVAEGADVASARATSPRPQRQTGRPTASSCRGTATATAGGPSAQAPRRHRRVPRHTAEILER